MEIIILLNNQALGLVHQQQHLFYEKRYSACLFEYAVDFPAMARAFGVRAIDLAEGGDPRERIRDEINTPGPCLIHVPIDIENRVYPMVPPGAANKDMIGDQAHAIAHA